MKILMGGNRVRRFVDGFARADPITRGAIVSAIADIFVLGSFEYKTLIDSVEYKNSYCFTDWLWKLGGWEKEFDNKIGYRLLPRLMSYLPSDDWKWISNFALALREAVMDNS